jgi:hypothetical protein
MPPVAISIVTAIGWASTKPDLNLPLAIEYPDAAHEMIY